MLDTSIPVEGMTYEGDGFEFVQSEVEKFWVEFRDIDGTLIEQQWVEKNGQATIPSTTPNYDSTYLEFDEWTPDGDLTNVKHNILAIATYKSKVDSTGYRPTIYKCKFDSNALSPSFAFPNYNATYFSNAYIDYGDGSTPEQITATAMPHTYATAGEYVVKIYGDKYYLSNTSNQSIFTSSAYEYNIILKKCYIGENARIGASAFHRSLELEVINIPLTVTQIEGSASLAWCKSLETICFPRTLVAIESDQFSATDKVRYMVYGSREITTSGYLEVKGFYIEHLVLPLKIVSNGKRISCYLSSCINLKDLILPEPANDVTFATLTLQNALIETFDISGYNFTGNFNNFYDLPKLKELKFPASIGTINGNYALRGLDSLEELEIPSGTLITKWNGAGNRRVKKLTLPSSITSAQTIGVYANHNPLKELILGTDWNANLTLKYLTGLKKESIIDIALKLKDNTGETAKTITFYSSTPISDIVKKTYILNGVEVDSATTGAVTIEAFIQAKNWTVSYSA